MTIPGPVGAGDFLLIVVSAGDILPIAGCSPIVNWTGLFFDPTNCGFFKVNSSGLEPPTVTVSHVGPLMTSFAWQSWRIANADFIHLTGPGPKYNPPLSNISLPQPGVPPPFEGPNSSAVAQNALWLGIITDSGFDDDLGSPWCTAAPVPYIALVNTQVGTVYPTAAAICSAERNLNALVEDPGLFTVVLGAPKPGIGGHSSWTIALWGASPPPTQVGQCAIPSEVLPQLPPEDPGRRYNRGFFGIDGGTPAGTEVWLSNEVANRPISREGQFAGLDMEALITSTTLFDFLTRGNDGVISGTLENVPGLFGRARCFTETQSVGIEVVDRFDEAAVLAWVSVNTTNNTDHALVSTDSWTLGYNNTTWYFSFFDTLNNTFRINATTNFTLNEWQGVAGGFNGFEIQITVDGATNRTRLFSVEEEIRVPGDNVLIGMDPTGVQFPVHAVVDEVAIFSSGLDNNTMFWATQRPEQVVISDPPDPPSGISGITLQGLIVWAAVGLVGVIIAWTFFVAIKELRERLGR